MLIACFKKLFGYMTVTNNRFFVTYQSYQYLLEKQHFYVVKDEASHRGCMCTV